MDAGSPDDYYALLGIDAEADDGELRRAWRQLALRWHPDRAGPDTTHIFQKIVAAYTVLCDPVARAAYDRRRGVPARSSAAGAGTAPGSRAGSQRPAASDGSQRRAPGVLLHRLSGTLTVLLACGAARRAEDGVIELFLDAEEAAEGGMASISMRVPVRCPECAVAPTLSCASCGSTGVVEEPFSAWLAIRPGVAEGTLLAPSALLPGMLRPVSFRVRLAASAT